MRSGNRTNPSQRLHATERDVTARMELSARSIHHHGCAGIAALRLWRDTRAIPLGFIHSDPEFIMAFSVCAIERSRRYTTTRVLGKAPNTTPNTGAGEAGTWHDENTPAWFKQKCSDRDIPSGALQTGSSRFVFNKNRPASRFALISSYKKHPVGVFTRVTCDILKVYKDSLPSRRTLRCAVAGDCG